MIRCSHPSCPACKLFATMNKDKIRPAPPRKRKKMCDVEYYDVEDIAPAAAQARPCQVHEWKGMDAHVSAYQYSMDALHSSQLPQSYWYSSLFSTAAPTSLEDKSWSIHDDVISQYDPVLDEQLPLKSKNARVRVGLSRKPDLDDKLIVN